MTVPRPVTSGARVAAEGRGGYLRTVESGHVDGALAFHAEAVVPSPPATLDARRGRPSARGCTRGTLESAVEMLLRRARRTRSRGREARRARAAPADPRATLADPRAPPPAGLRAGVGPRRGSSAVERRSAFFAKHLHGAHRAEGGETRAELVVEELARPAPKCSRAAGCFATVAMVSASVRVGGGGGEFSFPRLRQPSCRRSISTRGYRCARYANWRDDVDRRVETATEVGAPRCFARWSSSPLARMKTGTTRRSCTRLPPMSRGHPEATARRGRVLAAVLAKEPLLLWTVVGVALGVAAGLVARAAARLPARSSSSA